MKHIHTLTRTVLCSILLLPLTSAFAAPGTLTNSPLFVQATAKPNIMFLVDNSLSMNMVAEESDATNPDKYNKSTTYKATCSSPVASSQKIYIYISSGKPKVRFNVSSGTSYTADYALAESSTNICFATTTVYSAGLNATKGTQPKYSNNLAKYTGNYLNWYFKFDNTTTKWNAGQQLKPGTKSRKTIASESMTTLLTTLEATDVDIRVGLSSFYPASSKIGVKIFDEIRLLDSTHLASMTKHLKITSADQTNLGDGWGTPLGTSLYQIGRYYIGETGTAGPANGSLGITAGVNDTNGSYNGNLTIHPDATSSSSPPKKSVDDDVLFTYSPQYDSSLTPNKESPIQYWCQSNFAVVMTDGLPSVDRNNISSDLTDYDADCVGASPACANKTAGAPSTTPHYDMKGNLSTYTYLADNQKPSDYFDDVAQALFEVDLRPDINDYGTPTNPSGNPVKNNVITYTIAFADQDALSNKLLVDAGTQGGGEAISAADGGDLIKKFSEVTNKILATTSSAAAVTFNTSKLGSDTAVYQALFKTSRWSGDILSFPLNPTDGKINKGCTQDLTPSCWSAATHLDKLAYNGSTFVNNRQIITFDSSTKKVIPFKTPTDFTAPATNEITTTMINDMCAGPDAPLVGGVSCTSATSSAKTASQTYVKQMVEYIRGDRTYESISNSPTFRTRQTVLGDIINATPIFNGIPRLPWSSFEDTSNKFGVTGNRYSDFKTAQANRIKVIYASANDGMLHAFRTKTDSSSSTPTNTAGDEIFAFMPSFVFSNKSNEGYHYLAQPTYTHKYYLDLSPDFTDYYGRTKDTTQTNFKSTTDDWHTVLIGGSRGGLKKGIFALDVTDPLTITEATAADKVLWEFTNSDDVNLGHTFSNPVVAMTYAVDGAGVNRWAVVFGNGYQNDSTAVTNGTSCTAQLFIVFLDGGLDGTWTLGTNPNTADYMRIDTQVGTTAAGDCNGLSSPALADVNGDQILDRVYAGDLKGNMWAFDLTCGGASCGTSDFKVAYKQGTTPKPLFTAMDNQATPQPQPITAKPILARVDTTPTTGTSPNILVFFGTGQYHAASDNVGTNKINTVYGIWDSGTGKLTDDRSNSSTAKLVQQVLSTTTVGTSQIRNITSNPIDWTKKYGWYIDLAPKDSTTLNAEERSVVPPAVRSNVLFFNTLIPNSQICGYAGSGWLMSVNVATGGEAAVPVFDVNKDGVIDSNDILSGKIAAGEQFKGIPADSSFIGDNQYTQSSDKSIQKRKINLQNDVREGRVSWHELRNNN